jgi:hypothetical protein
LTLDASGSSDPDGDLLSFSWDVNGDGVFRDAGGVSPTLSPEQLRNLGIDDGPQSLEVSVQVTDSKGASDTSLPTVLTVNNVTPQATISGPEHGGVPGETLTFTLDATDPSVP